MGDVVGHGIEDASLMERLRNALRAYALETTSPAKVLAKLDRLMSQMDRGDMATLVYAVVDPDWTSLRFAGAGHPPPLLLGPDGRAEYLWDGRSPPLGVGGPRAEGTTAIDPGSTLALYTDGLVEVRGEMLTAGLDRLRDAVASGPEEPKALCAHVIESLLGDRVAGDDVAFLALRTTSPRGGLPDRASTDRTSLAYARRILARWLEQAGPRRATASRSSSPPTRRARTRSSTRTSSATRWSSWRAGCSTRRWRSPSATAAPGREQADGHRGRGLDLMNALMDGVTVNGGPDGTEVELRRRLRGQPRDLKPAVAHAQAALSGQQLEQLPSTSSRRQPCVTRS